MLARAYDAQGQEICADEIDPDHDFATVLQHLVAPVAATEPTAIEVLIDAIADVNRANPQVAFTTQLDADDYGNIAAEISDFLENEESGLEQVYAVIQEATSGDEAKVHPRPRWGPSHARGDRGALRARR